MESKAPRRDSTEFLEKRLELQEKLERKRFECDGLRARYEETMEIVRGLEISLRCAESGRDKMEAEIENISRILKSEMNGDP